MVKTAMSGTGLAPHDLKAASPRERDICNSQQQQEQYVTVGAGRKRRDQDLAETEPVYTVQHSKLSSISSRLFIHEHSQKEHDTQDEDTYRS